MYFLRLILIASIFVTHSSVALAQKCKDILIVKDQRLAQKLLIEKLQQYVQPNFIGLSVATFPGGAYEVEYESTLREMNVDLIVIENPLANSSEKTQLGPENGYFEKPEKVHWTLPVQPFSEYLTTRSGKERRRILSKLKKSESVHVVLAPLKVSTFDEWYQIYQKEVVGKTRGRRALLPQWALKQGGDLGKKYHGLFFRDPSNGQMLGGALLSLDKRSHTLMISYAAYSSDSKQLELSVRTVEQAMSFAVRSGFLTLSYGYDSNFYGHHLTPGLMEYKAGMGFTPNAAGRTEVVKVLNPVKLLDPYAFFTFSDRDGSPASRLNIFSESGISLIPPANSQLQHFPRSFGVPATTDKIPNAHVPFTLLSQLQDRAFFELLRDDILTKKQSHWIIKFIETYFTGTEPFDPILTPLFFIRSLHQGVSNEELGAMYRDVLSKQFTSTNSIAHAKRPSVAHSPELLTKRLIDSASPLAHFLVSQLLYSQFSSLRALENVLFVTDEHQPAYREVFENVRRLYGEEHYELFISRLDDYLQPIGEPGPKAVDSSSTISNIGSTSHRPSPIRLRHLRLEQIFLSNDRTEARELLTELHRILIDEVSIHPTLKRWAVPRHTVTPPASSVVLFLRHFLMSGPLFQEYVVEDIASRSTITTHSSAAISTRLKRLSELASNRSPKNTDPEQEWSFLKFWNLLLQIDVNYSHLPSYEDILITAGIKPFDISLEYRTLRDIWEEIYSRATEQQLTAILTTVSNFEQFRQKKDLSHTVRSKLTATATLKKNNLSKPFSEFASPVLITLFTYLRNSLDEMTSHFISAANPFLEQLAQWLEIKYSPRTHDINQIFDEAMEIVRKRIKLNETLPPAGAILQWTSFVHPNKIHLLGKELLDGAFPRLPPRSETLLAMLENFTALHQNKSVGVYLDREILAVFLLALARPDSREKAIELFLKLIENSDRVMVSGFYDAEGEINVFFKTLFEKIKKDSASHPGLAKIARTLIERDTYNHLHHDLLLFSAELLSLSGSDSSLFWNGLISLWNKNRNSKFFGADLLITRIEKVAKKNPKLATFLSDSPAAFFSFLESLSDKWIELTKERSNTLDSRRAFFLEEAIRNLTTTISRFAWVAPKLGTSTFGYPAPSVPTAIWYRFHRADFKIDFSKERALLASWIERHWETLDLSFVYSVWVWTLAPDTALVPAIILNFHRLAFESPETFRLFIRLFGPNQPEPVEALKFQTYANPLFVRNLVTNPIYSKMLAIDESFAKKILHFIEQPDFTTHYAGALVAFLFSTAESPRGILWRDGLLSGVSEQGLHNFIRLFQYWNNLDRNKQMEFLNDRFQEYEAELIGRTARLAFQGPANIDSKVAALKKSGANIPKDLLDHRERLVEIRKILRRFSQEQNPEAKKIISDELLKEIHQGRSVTFNPEIERAAILNFESSNMISRINLSKSEREQILKFLEQHANYLQKSGILHRLAAFSGFADETGIERLKQLLLAISDRDLSQIRDDKLFFDGKFLKLPDALTSAGLAPNLATTLVDVWRKEYSIRENVSSKQISFNATHEIQRWVKHGEEPVLTCQRLDSMAGPMRDTNWNRQFGACANADGRPIARILLPQLKLAELRVNGELVMRSVLELTVDINKDSQTVKPALLAEFAHADISLDEGTRQEWAAILRAKINEYADSIGIAIDNVYHAEDKPEGDEPFIHPEPLPADYRIYRDTFRTKNN